MIFPVLDKLQIRYLQVMLSFSSSQEISLSSWQWWWQRGSVLAYWDWGSRFDSQCRLVFQSDFLLQFPQHSPRTPGFSVFLSFLYNLLSCPSFPLHFLCCTKLTTNGLSLPLVSIKLALLEPSINSNWWSAVKRNRNKWTLLARSREEVFALLTKQPRVQISAKIFSSGIFLLNTA